MGKLAIRGHATRGREVIELLEMLGGKNGASLEGYNTARWYFLDKNNLICACTKFVMTDYITFTLEEFLNSNPYKIGDEVVIARGGIPYKAKVNAMRWNENINEVLYQVGDIYNVEAVDMMLTAHVEQINQEETMEQELKQAEIRERIVLPFGKERMEIVVADDCELVNEDGKMFVVRKQPQYPKTYEECCDILGRLYQATPEYNAALACGFNVKKFCELLVCRNAYWKLAGNWKPDWSDNDTCKFCIGVSCNKIETFNSGIAHYVLAFPTEEVRDAFYENFKDLIEECKELL